MPIKLIWAYPASFVSILVFQACAFVHDARPKISSFFNGEDPVSCTDCFSKHWIAANLNNIVVSPNMSVWRDAENK